MAEFNFGTLATTQSTSNSYAILKPWNIHKVKFAGARKEVFDGKKHPGEKYEVLKVRFENEDGYFEESIFYPRPKDTERPTYKNSEGHEYHGASNFERTMTFIAQVGTVLNPTGFKKMQELSPKFQSFDELVTAFIKITEPVKGKETNLKLVGRTKQDGSVVSALPKFVAISKKDELFTCDNFIGDKLFFSPYEEGKKAEYLNAKPTKMESTATNISTMSGSEDAAKNDDTIDFNSLL